VFFWCFFGDFSIKYAIKFIKVSNFGTLWTFGDFFEKNILKNFFFYMGTQSDWKQEVSLRIRAFIRIFWANGSQVPTSTIC
jgi:hypothetical protein